MDISNKRKQAARQRFTQLANKLRDRDMTSIFEASRAKLERLGQSVPESLGSLWDDIKTTASLVGSYSKGSYRQVPWRTLTAIGGALLYFVAPLDAIPDFLPLAGYLDDAFIFKLVFDLVGKDLEEYKHWQSRADIVEQTGFEDPA